MRDIFRQVIVLLSTVAVIVVNALANILPFNDLTTGEISDQFDVYFVPAGYVFSIWGLIYLGLLAYSIYQVLPSQRENPRLRQIGSLYVLSCAANIAWLFLWHYERFEWTIVAMIVLLVSLIGIYLILDTGYSRVSAAETWTVRVPFSIYLGWITVATIANMTSLLDYLGWGGWGIHPQWWAVIMLAVAAVVGVVMSLTRGDIAYVAVLVWAFVGIAIKHSDTMLVAVSAYIAVAVVVIALLIGVPLTHGRLQEIEANPPPTAVRDRW